MRRILATAMLGLLLLPAGAWAADFAAPRVYGETGGGILRFPQAIAYDASGVSDPAGPAGPYVYVADQYSFLVQKFTTGGTFVRQWGGYGSDAGHFGATSPNAAATATTGVVGGIGGLAVGAGGDVYVLDSLNDRVEQFSPTGQFKRAVGGPSSLNTGINGGLAIRGDALYVADQNNNRVQRFTLGTDGAPAFAASFGGPGTGNGQFNLPQGIAVDPEGDHDVFVADDRNHRVQRFSAAGTFEAATGSLGSGPGEFENPYDVSVNHDNVLFVADNQNHRVQEFEASSFTWRAQYGGLGTAPSQMANVRSLAALAATAAGGVFVGDTSSDAIDEFAVGGTFVRTWGRSGRTPGRFTLPRSIALDAAGNLLVADTRNDRIERLRADGSVIDVWGKISTLGFPTTGNGSKEFRDPTAVAVDPASGEVWTVEGGNHRVQRFAADGTWLATYGGVAAGSAPGQFTEPLGIAVGPGGEVLVADTRNDRVQRRDPATGLWSVLGGFVRPSAVAVGTDGRRYVAEAGAGRVRVLRPDGSIAATIAGLDAPEGVAVDAEGRVVVADTQRHRVLRYAPAGGGYELDTVLGGRGAEPGRFVLPIGVAADAAGAIWVVDAYNHRVQRFAPAGSPPSDGSPPPPAGVGAGASAPPAPAGTDGRRLAPRGLRLTVSPRRDRRAPYRFAVTGRLLLPAGVGVGAGCRGRVSVHVGRRERVATLRRDCTLRVVIRVPRSTRAGRLRVRATFMGNATLEPRAARTLMVRLG